MLQGYIFILLGKENITRKKGHMPEKDSPTCVRNTYAKPKNFT